MPKISFDKVREQIAKLNDNQLHDLLDGTITEINEKNGTHGNYQTKGVSHGKN